MGSGHWERPPRQALAKCATPTPRRPWEVGTGGVAIFRRGAQAQGGEGTGPRPVRSVCTCSLAPACPPAHQCPQRRRQPARPCCSSARPPSAVGRRQVSRWAQLPGPREGAGRRAHLSLLGPQLGHLCLHVELDPVVLKHLGGQVGKKSMHESVARGWAGCLGFRGAECWVPGWAHLHEGTTDTFPQKSPEGRLLQLHHGH